MYYYFKYKIILEKRFKLSSNMSLYISRLKDLVFKTFHLEKDWLYYIKHSETKD